MPLVTMKEILEPARAGGYAIAGLEFWSSESAKPIIDAAEAENMPVILQTGPAEIAYAGGAEAVCDFALPMARRAKVPVALHLDHGDTLDVATACLKAGFTSIMIDASHLPFEDNIALTRQVVAAARPYGATVESELGRLGGAEGLKTVADEEAAQTDPDQAAEFVERTGIDALAVAVGTVHGFYKFEPRINLDRLERIAKKVALPLVLHGGSGTPDEKITAAMRLGIAKVNICTEYIAAIGKTMSEIQARDGFKYSIVGLFDPPYAAGRQLAREKIRLFKAR